MVHSIKVIFFLIFLVSIPLITHFITYFKSLELKPCIHSSNWGFEVVRLLAHLQQRRFLQTFLPYDGKCLFGLEVLFYLSNIWCKMHKWMRSLRQTEFLPNTFHSWWQTGFVFIVLSMFATNLPKNLVGNTRLNIQLYNIIYCRIMLNFSSR